MGETTAVRPGREPRILSREYVATTAGMFALCAFVAFEATAVTTVMPTVAEELHGTSLFSLSFAAPLASGVVGMVGAGGWSDRRGAVRPLAAALVLFALGLVGCGLAPSMPALIAARVVQGLGGGALTVCLYVLVGLLYPPALRPAVFSSFAAAWVLPTLFGPVLAAYVAQAFGWRWVFLGVVVMVAGACGLIAPALRGVVPSTSGQRAPRSRLLWSVLAAVAVLAMQLLGTARVVLTPLTVVAAAVVLLAIRPLVPAGTLVARPGLPAVIATRAMLSGAFFCGETYIIYVLEQRWGLSAGVAGVALTGVGLSWSGASWVQSRLSRTLGDGDAMRAGSVVVLLGIVGLTASAAWHPPAVVAAATYVVAGFGMGLAYPRTSVAMLAESGDADRGFNSSALSIADALGGATTIATSGVVFATAGHLGGDTFTSALAVGCCAAVLGVAASLRTRRT